MHPLQLLVGTSVLTCYAFAHSHGGPGKLHNHAQLFKRQIEPGAGGLPDGIPAECTDVCITYMNVASKCYEIPAESSNNDADIQEHILQCACTEEFFQSTQACMGCTPGTFNDGGVQEMVDQALAQCAASGHPVGGALQGAQPSSGTKAPIEEESDVDVSSSISDVEAVPTSTGKPAASVTLPSTTAPQISSPAPTGAASLIRAPGILALAIGLSPAALGMLYPL